MNSCIDISAKRAGDILSFQLSRLREDVSFVAERKGGPISVRSKRANEMLSFGVQRKGESITFRCGLVCTVGSKYYLRVPQDSIWLLPENDFSQEVVVYSNVTWTIE